MKKSSDTDTTITFELVRYDEEANLLDDLDDAFRKHVTERRERGDAWAWCWVVVRAQWMMLSGEASLGGCSYEDIDDFKRSHEFHDLCYEALQDLENKVNQLAEHFESP